MKSARVCHCQSCVKGCRNIGVMLAIFLSIAITADADFSITKRSANNPVCETEGCKELATLLRKYKNEKADPCEDFYDFACGGFISSTPLPSDKGYISTFEIMKDTINERLNELLKAESGADEIKPFRLAKTLYKACMDTDTIDSEGFKSLLKKLDESGGWPVLNKASFNEDNFDWASSMFEFDDATYLANLYVYADTKNSASRTIYLDQPTFALPYDFMTKGTDHKFVQAYLKYMVDVAVILGADATVAETELKKVLELELKLCSITLPPEKRLYPFETYYPTTLGELSKNLSSIPWEKILGELFSPEIEIKDDEKIVVLTPEYFIELLKIMENTDKVVQANYVRWRVVLNSAQYLNDALRKAHDNFMHATEGTTEAKPRWEKCVEIVSSKLPFSSGSMYVREYFKPSAKKSFIDLVKEVQNMLRAILTETPMFDDGSRNWALTKIDKMSFHIGYHDDLVDDAKLLELYKNLELPQSSFHDMIMEINKFEAKRVCTTLREPVEKNDWRFATSPTIVNAFYNRLENSVHLSAGILQGIIYNEDRPKYLNYATVGYFIAHMMTNGFDNEGKQYDADGNFGNWWTPETDAKFLKEVQCIEEQYGNYTFGKNNLKLNGKASVNANIAGIGGLKIIYRAYVNEAQKHESEPLLSLPDIDLPPNHLFWLALAAPWCAKYTDETLEKLILSGGHVPEKFRIIGPFSNFEPVAKDFGCGEGSSIYRENRCDIW